LRDVTIANRHDIEIDRRSLEPWSARALAGRLAAVCDRIAA
jgi:hypothetical protein